MAVHKINADYPGVGPLDHLAENPDSGRIEVFTRTAYGELRLSEDDYESILSIVQDAAAEQSEAACSITNGEFKLSQVEGEDRDPWDVEMSQQGLRYRFTLSTEELSGLRDLLESVHPDYDPNRENENLELH